MKNIDIDAMKTPAADRFAAEAPALQRVIEEARAAEKAVLAGKTADEIRVLAADVVEVKAKDTKKSLIEDIADDRVRALPSSKALRDLVDARRREERIIEAIAAAPAKVEKAKAEIADAVAQWGPEQVIDAAAAWEHTKTEAWLWASVLYVSVEEGLSPDAALVKVARSAASDVITNALHGSRSGDAARSLVATQNLKGTASFLRTAGYMSPEINDLVRY